MLTTKIADFIYPGFLDAGEAFSDDESIRLVTCICEHNDVMTLFIYDPLEEQLPDAGRVIVSEADMQLAINTSDARLHVRFGYDDSPRIGELILQRIIDEQGHHVVVFADACHQADRLVICTKAIGYQDHEKIVVRHP